MNKKRTITNIGYQSAIINKNLINLVQNKKSMEDKLATQKTCNLGKSSEITSRNQQIPLFIEHIFELRAQIEKLPLTYSSSNNKKSQTLFILS